MKLVINLDNLIEIFRHSQLFKEEFIIVLETYSFVEQLKKFLDNFKNKRVVSKWLIFSLMKNRIRIKVKYILTSKIEERWQNI